MSGVIVVSAPDPRTGRDRVNVVGTIDGGGGARRGVDGLDGSEVRYSQRSVPVEVIEIETVLVMRALRLVPDSRRAGQFVSGAALEIEMENTSNRAVITVRNLNRFVFAPWGFKGGEIGLLGKAVVNAGRSDERSVGKISVLELGQGDILTITSSTGGAFGEPLERDVAAIAREIENGMLSPERAADVYAVVFDRDGKIDQSATAERRRERGNRRSGDFNFCIERQRHDQVWSPQPRRQLASRALTYEQRIRSQLVDRVHHRLLAKGEGVDAEKLDQVIAEEAGRL